MIPNNSKRKSVGNRASASNYCKFCVYRGKTKPVMCNRYNTRVQDTMKLCALLEPFRKYKLSKVGESNGGNTTKKEVSN